MANALATVVLAGSAVLWLAMPASSAEIADKGSPIAGSVSAQRTAKRLLQVSGTAEKFTSTAQQQIRNIIRTYASIVNMELDVTLPDTVKNRITDCYRRVYAWENFEDGIASILSQHLSGKEMLILIDYYRGLGLSPPDIDTFKALDTKAATIEAKSADYMFANSDGCVELNATSISRYLTTQAPLIYYSTDKQDSKSRLDVFQLLWNKLVGH
ncbi:MAG: hypothetical protein OXE78_15375 [Gammaproteobacteria bacterium]|nr:hypothetical protein [Gammaproteobacteria bacterium]